MLYSLSLSYSLSYFLLKSVNKNLKTKGGLFWFYFILIFSYDIVITVKKILKRKKLAPIDYF